MFVGHDEKQERMEIMELRGLLHTNILSCLHMYVHVQIRIQCYVYMHAFVPVCVYSIYVHINFCSCMYGSTRRECILYPLIHCIVNHRCTMYSS